MSFYYQYKCLKCHKLIQTDNSHLLLSRFEIHKFCKHIVDPLQGEQLQFECDYCHDIVTISEFTYLPLEFFQNHECNKMKSIRLERELETDDIHEIQTVDFWRRFGNGYING